MEKLVTIKTGAYNLNIEQFIDLASEYFGYMVVPAGNGENGDKIEFVFKESDISADENSEIMSAAVLVAGFKEALGPFKIRKT
jgi:hypothetical protein